MNKTPRFCRQENHASRSLIAGAAAADVTPKDRQFLFGYPHVARYSTGVHDRLLSSALYLSDGRTPLILVANDVIYISRDTARRVRSRIEKQTGIPAANMMITATHTHSGPLTVDTLSNETDPAVPKTDPRYVEQFEDGIVDAAVEAYRNARPAKLGLAVADGSSVGAHRHDPKGPSDPNVPVLVVRDARSDAYLAVMLVCSMHPTVLHEDTTLVSGDFPAMTRQYLQNRVLGLGCPVLHHSGPCGNQSPRHVTKANTFDEAKRLGGLLGQSVAEVLDSVEYSDTITFGCEQQFVDLPRRVLMSVAEAEAHLEHVIERLAELRRSKADRQEVRTAECDWFGAEESVALARAAAAGRLDKTVASVMPAEISLMRIGPWSFAGWPGEIFVDFSLRIKSQYPNCYVISLADGELQGYLTTEEAVRNQWYEAANALFASPESGMLLVARTLKMLENTTAR